MDTLNEHEAINYDELDPECVEMVKFFNSHGLPTVMCCQGHNRVDQSLYWIQFKTTVKSSDIVKFQSRYLDYLGNFCSRGHFGRRLVSASVPKEGSTENKLIAYGSWEYVASNPDAARADLADWLKFENANKSARN